MAFDGTDYLGGMAPSTEAAPDALYIERVSDTVFNLGFIKADVKTFLDSFTVTNTAIGNAIGFYANANSSNDSTVTLDNLRIVGDTPLTYSLTLAVNDEANPPVSDTMTIAVYDNACQAAIATGLTYDPADLNEDCITDLYDFAEVAGQWLTDISLTEPVPVP